DALHFEDERTTRNRNVFSSCCKNGEMGDRFRPPTYPQPLRKLFTDSIPGSGASPAEIAKSKQFLRNIRHYNNDCACASLSHKSARVDGPSLFVYKIQGTIYH